MIIATKISYFGKKYQYMGLEIMEYSGKFYLINEMPN